MTTTVAAPGRLLPQRGAALAEQVLVSGANFVAFVLMARAAAPARWGEFALAYAVVLFLQGFQRALVTLPMIAFSATAAGWAPVRGAWSGANTALALVSTLLLLALGGGAAALGVEWVRNCVWMAAAMVLPMMVHEFARRAAVQESGFGVLVTMGAAYAVVLLAGAALLYVPDLHLPGLPAIGVATASGAAALVYRLGQRRPVLPRPRPLPGDPGYAEFGAWAVLGHLGYSGYNFGIQLVLAGLAGPAAVGAFHACRTLLQPVSTLMGAMDSIDKPRAAAALRSEGRAGLFRVLGRNARLLALASVPFIGLVALAAQPLLELAYGSRYADQRDVVLMWCVVTLCTLASQPVESGLYVARRTRTLFYGRLGAALLSLAAALPLVAHHGSAGALLAMALGFALAATFGLHSLRRLPPQP